MLFYSQNRGQISDIYMAFNLLVIPFFVRSIGVIRFYPFRILTAMHNDLQASVNKRDEA